jgi:hypothetical protein
MTPLHCHCLGLYCAPDRPCQLRFGQRKEVKQ